MAYQVFLSPAALRDLKRIRGTARQRVAEAIDALANDPRPRGHRKLEGADELYRVRAGEYRIVYEIADERLIVLVVRIGHRKDIYREGR